MVTAPFSRRQQSAQLSPTVDPGTSPTDNSASEPVIGAVPRLALGAEALVERMQTLPPMNGEALRRDVDELIDPTL